MIEKILNLKSWQLVLLLSNYWFISILVQRDSLLLDVLLLINMGLLFSWYYLVIRAVNTAVGLKLKFIYGYNLTVIYLIVYMIIEFIPIQYEVLHWVLWHYIAFLGYLFAVFYVTTCFVKAERRKGIGHSNILFSFVQFFIYPVGIFFINKRIKKIITPKH